MNFFQKHWDGQYSVEKSFWLLGVLLPLALFLPFNFVPNSKLLSCAHLILGLVFIVWWTVGMWQSCQNPANNQNGKKRFIVIKLFLAFSVVVQLSSYFSLITQAFSRN
jgi:hypothetical protein